MLAFEILGPLVVRDENGEIPISGVRRRALLLRLLITANELVPAGPLAEDLWEGDPPAGAATTLRSHILRLRTSLGPGCLVGRHGGYVLEVTPDQLDVWRFEEESRLGRDALAAMDPATAAGLLDTALGRWRGQALADVSGTSWARAEQTRLEELRLGAIESSLEARLELGRHQEVVASAEAAIVDHPLREGIWGYLMLGLYRSGRQSDALRAYQRLRTILGEELGIEPSAQLVALDDAIVQQRPEVEWSVSGAAVGSAWRAVDAATNAATKIVTVRSGGPDLPSGTVTLLFTDIEGSTQLWEAHPVAMRTVLAQHDDLVRGAVTGEGGRVFKTVGDETCAVFATPQQALVAAVTAQRALAAGDWLDGIPIRVRMGLHTGVCEERDSDYFGPTVNRTARLMATASGGQIVVSGATAELLGDIALDGFSLLDLGEHKLKDLARPEHVFQIVAPGLDRDFPPLRSQSRAGRTDNLPQPISSFVGRTAELAELRKLLTDARVMTMVGPGGVGKTRLALELAAERIDDANQGVWFVDLAPVGDAGLVPLTVLNVLGVREETGRPPVETLVEALRNQEMLVVLDNCEHVIAPAAAVAERLVLGCPGVDVLATSREPLAIAGEYVFRVPSMSVPGEGEEGTDLLVASEAVRLFAERAAQHSPGFALESAGAPTIGRLCRRLDGIPFAIELATARLRSMSVADLERRLDQRFPLLSSGSRTALPRQQTLEALIDWSYELLSGLEQTVLDRLSIFAGGFDLDAVEAIVHGTGVDENDVLNLVTSLVDKSLVQADDTGGVTTARYRLLESIRDYAAEKLSGRETEEITWLRRDHQDYFLALAESGATQLTGADQVEWLDRLEREHGNLRAALTHCLDDADPAPGLRLGAALAPFWLNRGHGAEGAERLQAQLDRPVTQPNLLRGRCLVGAARLLVGVVGDYSGAIARADEALGMARADHEDRLIAEALRVLAWAHLQRDGFDAAVSVIDEGLDIARRLGDGHLEADLLNAKGCALYERGDDAVPCFGEALELFQAAGDRIKVAVVLSNIASAELVTGEIALARRHLEQALSLNREVDGRDLLSRALFNLGLAVYLDGDDATAHGHFQEALEVARRTGEKSQLGYCLLGLALAARHDGDPTRAARLHGAASVYFDEGAEQLQGLESGLRDGDQARLRGLLGDDSFDDLYRYGRSLSLDEV